MSVELTQQSGKNSTPVADKHKFPRQVQPNPSVSVTSSSFCTNQIRTARYTIITFLPVSIMIQFTKIANVSWVVVMILNAFKQISVNSPVVVAIVLGIIITIGVIKEGISDYSRHQSDKKTNATPVMKIGTLDRKSSSHIVKTQLKDVKVGDILVLEDKQQIPADCVVLQVTNENGQDDGYIQTAQLDGERNLKPKMPIKKAQAQIEDYFGGQIKIQISCEAPNPNLYHFDGQLSITDSKGQSEDFNLGLSNFIPRGALVSNCKMLAVVIYTGKDSKIILNQGHYSYKYSSIEKKLNKIFLIQIAQVLGLCVIFTLFGNAFVTKNTNMPQYNISDKNYSQVIGYSFLSFFLMLMRLVPLDLIINTEIGKIVVSKMIQFDAEMVSVDTATGELIPCKVQSMQLPEELGCINHIFCDKTGTLTKNELEFRGISFKGNLCQGRVTSEILNQVYQKNSKTAELLFKCFVICHDVIPMTVKGQVVMSGTSQDELIVIDVAKQSLYFTLIKRDSESIVLQDNQDQSMIEIKVLKTFEFSSDRKMMTVVVEMAGKTYAFVKGADTSIEPRCINLDNSDKMSLDDLDDFAEQGLRTLCYAYKEISQKFTAQQIENLKCEEMECDLQLLGVTGVEDLLQDDVKQCIVDFKEAGCKVWILTGDKGATANQIGISCGVLSPQRQIFQIDEINENTDPTQWKGKDILISGQVITELLNDKKSKLMDELLDTEGLVVYRSSPAQKADIVKYVRNARKDQITLAIGDGANDVNMIESAHVGIGIMGKEGNQAASFADFAVNQYNDLRRLLLWHGNNWLSKLTLFTLLIICKTSVFGLACVFYNTTTGFSGTNYVTDSLFAVFSINVTYYGFYNWFEQVVSFKYRKFESALPFKMSQHYAWQRDFAAKYWIRNFIVFMFFAYYAANVAFMVPFYAFGGTIDKNGKTVDMWAVGMMIYVLCVFFTHSLFVIFVRNWDRSMAIFTAVIWVQWILLFIIVNAGVKQDPLYKNMIEMIFDVHFWSVLFVTIALMVFPLVIYRFSSSLIVFNKFNFA